MALCLSVTSQCPIKTAKHHTIAFERAIDEPYTLPLSPQRVAQNAILLFLQVKYNFCPKKSATKFLFVKTSSGKVVIPLSNGP